MGGVLTGGGYRGGGWGYDSILNIVGMSSLTSLTSVPPAQLPPGGGGPGMPDIRNVFAKRKFLHLPG